MTLRCEDGHVWHVYGDEPNATCICGAKSEPVPPKLRLVGKRTATKRSAALDEVVSISEDLGLYDLPHMEGTRT